GQDRIVADVVDLIEAVGAVTQDHVCRRAGRRRRIRSGDHTEAVDGGAARAVIVAPDDLARGVDAACNGAGDARYGHWIVEGEVGSAAQEEAVRVVARVSEKPDDLACIVDAKGLSAANAQGIVEGDKAAAGGTEEAVDAAGIGVIPDDLACIVDAACLGAFGGTTVGEGISQRSEAAAAATKKAVAAGGIIVLPDDLACIVDAKCLGPARGGRRIVDRGEDVAVQEEAVKAGGVVV